LEVLAGAGRVLTLPLLLERRDERLDSVRAGHPVPEVGHDRVLARDWPAAKAVKMRVATWASPWSTTGTRRGFDGSAGSDSGTLA
jgi:hypothetical protein